MIKFPFPTTNDNLSPLELTRRYYWACREYLVLLLRRWQVRNAEDVADAVMEKPVTFGGLPDLMTKWKSSGGKKKGRFRYYLTRVLRNAAAKYLRRPAKETSLADWDAVGAEEDVAGLSLGPNILANALKELKVMQKARTGIALYPEVEAMIDAYLCAIASKADKEVMDEHLNRLAGELRESPQGYPDRERARATRARKELAICLVRAVSETLVDPTPTNISEELADLGLLVFVKPFLPAVWARCDELADDGDSGK